MTPCVLSSIYVCVILHLIYVHVCVLLREMLMTVGKGGYYVFHVSMNNNIQATNIWRDLFHSVKVLMFLRIVTFVQIHCIYLPK